MTGGRIFLYLALLMAALLAGLTFYPEVLFGTRLNARNMVIYSDGPLDMSAADLLGRVTDKLALSDFYDAQQEFQVYLGDGYGKYALLAPFCGKTYACVHPLSGKLFVALAEFQKNAAHDPADPEKTRALDSVLTHELVKAQIRNKLGALKFIALPDWQKDGYAEHIALEAGDADPSVICPGAGGRDPRALYLKDRLIIEEVKAANDTTYTAIMDGDRKGEDAEKAVLRRYCR